MVTRTLLARCAPLAIAASAAFPLLPAAAQEAPVANPVIVLPPVEAALPAPAPTIVLPATEPIAVAPVEQVEEPVAATSTARAEAAPAQTRAPRAAAAIASPAVAAEPGAVLQTVPAATLPPTSPPVAQAGPTADAVAVADDGTNEALIAGLLGALGIAAVGGVALLARRRRRADEVDTASRVATEPGPVEEPVLAPESAAAIPPMVAPAIVPRARNSSAARAGGDPVALPHAVPATYEERDALLKALVAAEPDRANPFTSVRARARRAKLIMQSLTEDFRGRKPRIDLSEYTHRWPALRGWQPATA